MTDLTEVFLDKAAKDNSLLNIPNCMKQERCTKEVGFVIFIYDICHSGLTLINFINQLKPDLLKFLITKKTRLIFYNIVLKNSICNNFYQIFWIMRFRICTQYKM